jgi:hypothetical protein
MEEQKMQNKKCYVLCLILVLGLTLGSTAQDITSGLLSHWRLSEGSGATALDSAGGNHGTLMEDATWTDGMIGGGVLLDGEGDYVNCGNDNSFNISASVSLAAWVQPDTGFAYPDWSGIIMRGGPNLDTFAFYYNGNTENLGFKTTGTTGSTWMATPAPGLLDGEWHHVAAVYNGASKMIYMDAQEVISANSTGPIETSDGNLLLGAGRDLDPPTHYLAGKLDDARIYTRDLSVEEIELLMLAQDHPRGVALQPNPEDEADDVPLPVTLAWRPGEFAQQHDVYLGTSFADVNNADAIDPMGVLLAQGLDVNHLDTDQLEFGQTYFWRVDEVNGAPDHTIIKGLVWEFTVEPVGYPIVNITATASSSQAPDMGPEKSIDGSGLDALDQHNTDGTDMWLSGAGVVPVWIQYEFDKTYKLHEMWVWNSNQLIEAILGLGAKDVVIETSMDGSDWAPVEDAAQFAQGTAKPDYVYNTTVSLGSVLAKFVRITINSGYGMLPQYGLSEVRFFAVPTAARGPEPADGAITESANIVLNWRAGREAASHQVYLGTDSADLSLIGTTSESRFDAGPLDYAQTYYWSVTEINEAETPSSYAGDTWRFSLPDYGVVDDFEQYDNDCQRIFFAWEDGLGHSGGAEIEGCDVPESNGNGGGSIVGNAVAPFAEKSIVNVDSKQSMPLSYDNAFGPSETTLTLVSQDWTTGGVQTLSLFFYGQPDNSGQLYVKINNTKLIYNGDAADITAAQWQQWNIDLNAVPGLQNVTVLTIGVDGASAAGMLYIDDIRLYP